MKFNGFYNQTIIDELYENNFSGVMRTEFRFEETFL